MKILEYIEKPSKTSLTNILLELHEKGLICDSNILNKYSDQLMLTPRRIDTIRKYYELGSPLLFLAYYTTCLVTLLKNGETPIYYCDLIAYFPGTITQFFYIMAILGSVLALNFIKAFNFSEESDYYWLKAFEFLKSYEKLKEYPVTNLSEIGKLKLTLIKKIILVSWLAKHYHKFLFICILLLTTFLALINLFAEHQYVYGCIGIFILITYVSASNVVFLQAILSFYIVTNYCKTEFFIFNKALSPNNTQLFRNSREVYYIITKHNTICKHIFRFNRFWSRVYSTLLYTTLPIAQLLLHQLLFSDLKNVFLAIVSAAGIVLMVFADFAMNLSTASINKQANNSYKVILTFMNNHPRIGLRNKIKVYFDSLTIYSSWLIYLDSLVAKLFGKGEFQDK